jgi:hypothetical protein
MISNRCVGEKKWSRSRKGKASKVVGSVSHFNRRIRASARSLRFKWNILLFKRNDNGTKLGELIENTSCPFSS